VTTLPPPPPPQAAAAPLALALAMLRPEAGVLPCGARRVVSRTGAEAMRPKTGRKQSTCPGLAAELPKVAPIGCAAGGGSPAPRRLTALLDSAEATAEGESSRAVSAFPDGEVNKGVNEADPTIGW